MAERTACSVARRLADVLHALARDYGEQLDATAVRAQVVALVGEDDVRLREWDSIVAVAFGSDGEQP